MPDEPVEFELYDLKANKLGVVRKVGDHFKVEITDEDFWQTFEELRKKRREAEMEEWVNGNQRDPQTSQEDRDEFRRMFGFDL